MVKTVKEQPSKKSDVNMKEYGPDYPVPSLKSFPFDNL